jgi:hypothetical protein
MMIAHVYLKKGDDVPRHSHENERSGGCAVALLVLMFPAFQLPRMIAS